MLKNYFLLAARNLAKHKGFSLINILGLSMGLCCCILIAAYVFDELSYDRYPEKAARIYRLQLNVAGNGSIDSYTNVDIAVGEGMKDAFGEIQDYTRLLPARESFVEYQEKKFKEQKLAYADPNFLALFSIPFVNGDRAAALSAPNSIVVTRDFAHKYFANENPIGKILTMGIASYKVTGLIEKIPANTHFHFDAFMSMASLHQTAHTWSNLGYYTYLILKPGTDAAKLEAKFPDMVAKHVVPEVQHDMGVSLAEAQKSVNNFRFFLQPLPRIHLYSDTKYELEPNGDIKYVYVFSALAVFILLLACINFTNLSTARSAKRAREVGIRKVMGSDRKRLAAQFLAESVVLAYCAVALAFLAAYLLLPYFNQLSGKQLDFSFFTRPVSITTVLLLGLLTGIIAGAYPAFFLSSFNAIAVLKNTGSTTSTHKSPLRSGLVVFQFAVSTGLIAATIIIYQQLHFMQDKKLGYDKEQVLYLQDTHLLGNGKLQEAFKQFLLKDARVVNASIGTNVPGNPDMDGTQVYAKDKIANEGDAEIHANIFRVDYDYIPTLGIKMKAGRNFSRDFPTDSFGVVINNAAVEALGWRRTDATGKTIMASGQHAYKVIGVTEDFHYASVKQKIAPLLLRLGGNYRSGLIVKIKTTDVRGLLADIKNQWMAMSPGAPFAYYFLDSRFANLYSSEQKTGQVITSFSLLAMAIACLGLFGLAIHITQQRAKEIGIRKVFGASVQQLLFLVSRDFLLLVCISFLISIPLTWWGMHRWLQDFAYRINIGWQAFFVAAITAVVLAAITVGFQAIKSAVANPVKSLRTE